AACARARPPPPPQPAGPTYEQKIAWILRLEDQRILRDQGPPAAPPVVVPPPPARRGQPAVVAPPPPPPPDLIRLLGDSEARTRRRAALAVGHVGLREGVEPLAALLKSDSDP